MKKMTLFARHPHSIRPTLPALPNPHRLWRAMLWAAACIVLAIVALCGKFFLNTVAAFRQPTVPLQSEHALHLGAMEKNLRATEILLEEKETRAYPPAIDPSRFE